MQLMKFLKIRLFFLFTLFSISSYSQIVIDNSYLNIVSWNIQNFGRSKSDVEIKYISEKVKGCDIVAIQEVSTSEFGAQAVAKLDSCLDKTGSDWDYVISDPTSGSGSERYAYLFKKHRVKLKDKPSLEKSLSDSLNREPFRATFIFKKKEYYLFNVHLVPEGKNPEREANLLSGIAKLYVNKNVVIMGDFNLSSSSTGFDSLKKEGYKSLLIGQKTSLKAKESDDPLNKEYDNFFVSKSIKSNKSGIIPFYKDFKTLKETRSISDHCPIWCQIK